MTGVEPVWIEERDVLALHDQLLAFHGGAAGLRDQGLLLSALARAKHIFAYDNDVGFAAMATAYTTGIVKHHPFVDGNKRTAFVMGILFLELNGFRFTAAEDMAAETVIALAAGTLDETRYTSFLRENILPE